MSPELTFPEVGAVDQEKLWRTALKEDLKMLASKLKPSNLLLLSQLAISNIIVIGANSLEHILPLNSQGELEAALPMPTQALRTCQSIVPSVMSGQEQTTSPCPMPDPQLRQK